MTDFFQSSSSDTTSIGDEMQQLMTKPTGTCMQNCDSSPPVYADWLREAVTRLQNLNSSTSSSPLMMSSAQPVDSILSNGLFRPVPSTPTQLQKYPGELQVIIHSLIV